MKMMIIAMMRNKYDDHEGSNDLLEALASPQLIAAFNLQSHCELVLSLVIKSVDDDDEDDDDDGSK